MKKTIFFATLLISNLSYAYWCSRPDACKKTLIHSYTSPQANYVETIDTTPIDSGLIQAQITELIQKKKVIKEEDDQHRFDVLLYSYAYPARGKVNYLVETKSSHQVHLHNKTHDSGQKAGFLVRTKQWADGTLIKSETYYIELEHSTRFYERYEMISGVVKSEPNTYILSAETTSYNLVDACHWHENDITIIP